MPPSAISGTPRALQRGGDVVDRRDLRHADAGDDARGADRAGTDADLHGVGAGLDQRQRGLAGGDVAADHVDAADSCCLTQRTRSSTPALWPWAVSTTIDVDAGLDQQLDALFGALADADGGADAQLAVRVARGVGEAGLLGDVLDGHQAAQLERVVDDQHALELVLVHQRLAVFERGAFAAR